MLNPQLNSKGNLNHLLSIDGLSKERIIQILDTAESFLKIGERDVKKVPILRGKTVCNVFFENSTRTRTTFEIAAKRLSADVINLNVATSSQSKGETILDTINNLIAMNADIFVEDDYMSNALNSFVTYLADGNTLTSRQARTMFKVENVADLAYRARNAGVSIYTNRTINSRGEKVCTYRLGTPSEQFGKYFDRGQLARARKTLYRDAISVSMAA